MILVFPYCITKRCLHPSSPFSSGVLLDSHHLTLAIPQDKQQFVIGLLQQFIQKKKATVKELQALCGYLNFLAKIIIPGRVFLRRMYSKYSKCVDFPHSFNKFSPEFQLKRKLKQHHHVRLDREFKSDCSIWLKFLTTEEMHKIINRPMVDVVLPLTNVEVLDFYSDASAAVDLGFGCILDGSWLCKKWEPGFIQEKEPSIEYLELFALIAGVLTWSETKLTNRRVVIFCDNMAVVHMVNKNASTCRHCMTLLRLLVLNCTSPTMLK